MDLPDAVLILRICCGVLLLWAGLHKLVNLGATREAILGYRVIPFRFVRVAAVVLSAAEFVTGVLLVIGVMPGIASVAALARLRGLRWRHRLNPGPGDQDGVQLLQHLPV